MPPVWTSARAGHGLAHLDVCGGSRDSASRAWRLCRRIAAHRDADAARARQPQPAARRSVLHGAGQLASPRRRASVGARVPALRLRRLRTSARIGQGQGHRGARRHEGDLRSGHSKDDGAQRVSAQGPAQSPVSRSAHRSLDVAGGDDREGTVRRRSARVSLRLHLPRVFERAGRADSCVRR